MEAIAILLVELPPSAVIEDVSLLAGSPEITPAGVRVLLDSGDWTPSPDRVVPVDTTEEMRARLRLSLTSVKPPGSAASFDLVETVDGMVVQSAGGCTVLRASGDNPQAFAELRSGGWVTLVSSESGAIEVLLADEGACLDARSVQLNVDADAPVWLRVAPVGDEVTEVRIDQTLDSVLTVCGA